MTRSHRQSGARGLRSLGLLLLLSLIALVAGAGPAAAAETIQGSGAGVGFSTISEEGDPTFPLCLPGDAGSQYVINVPAGVVAAAETTPNSSAVYTGPLTVTVTLTTDFFFGPAGISTDSTCAVPGPVPATIAVSGSSGSASVSCPIDEGVFTRTNTTIEFNEALELPGLDGDCTVDDGATEVTVSPVTHAFVGNEYPCLDPPGTCPGPVASVHVQGEWTVTGADLTN